MGYWRSQLSKIRGLDPKFIEKLIPILVLYNMISYTFKYEIKAHKIYINPVENSITDKRLMISKNQYNNCVEEWLKKKSIKCYNNFTEHFKNRVSKEKEPKEWEKNMELV